MTSGIIFIGESHPSPLPHSLTGLSPSSQRDEAHAVGGIQSHQPSASASGNHRPFIRWNISAIRKHRTSKMPPSDCSEAEADIFFKIVIELGCRVLLQQQHFAGSGNGSGRQPVKIKTAAHIPGRPGQAMITRFEPAVGKQRDLRSQNIIDPQLYVLGRR